MYPLSLILHTTHLITPTNSTSAHPARDPSGRNGTVYYTYTSMNGWSLRPSGFLWCSTQTSPRRRVCQHALPRHTHPPVIHPMARAPCFSLCAVPSPSLVSLRHLRPSPVTPSPRPTEPHLQPTRLASTSHQFPWRHPPSSAQPTVQIAFLPCVSQGWSNNPRFLGQLSPSSDSLLALLTLLSRS